jgi:hypothetical protein
VWRGKRERRNKRQEAHLFNAEPTDNGHMRAALLELVEDSKEGLVVGHEWHLVQGYLAQGHRVWQPITINHCTESTKRNETHLSDQAEHSA